MATPVPRRHIQIVKSVVPTLEDVRVAVEATEPATADEVRKHLGQPWERRQTVRNRLDDLVLAGVLIRDERRPARYAINTLTP